MLATFEVTALTNDGDDGNNSIYKACWSGDFTRANGAKEKLHTSMQRNMATAYLKRDPCNAAEGLAAMSVLLAHDMWMHVSRDHPI